MTFNDKLLHSYADKEKFVIKNAFSGAGNASIDILSDDKNNSLTFHKAFYYLGVGFVLLFLIGTLIFFLKSFSAHELALQNLNQQEQAAEHQALFVSLMHEVEEFNILNVQKSFAAEYAYVKGGDLLVQFQLPVSLEGALEDSALNWNSGSRTQNGDMGYATNEVVVIIDKFLNFFTGVKFGAIPYAFSLFFGTVVIFFAAFWLRVKFSKKI